MNKKVFIIGAGAHVDFGMPTGHQLTESLLLTHRVLKKYPNSFYEKHNFQDPLTDLGFLKYNDQFSRDRLSFTLDKINLNLQNLSFLNRFQNQQDFVSFIKLFDQSGQSSIDSFLSEQDKNHRYHDKYFKGFLGLYIQAMQEFALLNHTKPNWIRRLLSTVPLEDLIDNNKFSFLTFNYDTILEDIIYDFLIAQHGKPHEEALKILDKIEIYHLYGKVPSKHQQNLKPEVLDFNKNKIDSEKADYHLIKSNNDINIVRDYRIANDEEGYLSQMTQKQFIKYDSDPLISKLNLVFLGFGFDRHNVKLLLHKMPSKVRPNCWMTTKMTAGQINKALVLLEPNIHNLMTPKDLNLSIEDVLFDSNFLD